MIKSIRASKYSWLASSALLLLLGAAPLAHAVGIDRRTCKPVPPELAQLLTSAWQPFLPFTRACTLRNEQAKPALYIVSVWLKQYNSAPKPAGRRPPIPKPMIFLVNNKHSAGSLPMHFPDDPPHEVNLDFADWSDGSPHQIIMSVNNPAALGGQVLPVLVWQSEKKQFIPNY